MKGFSLIELMISLALFGLIASGAMALVMSGARSQQRSARVDVVQSGIRAGLDFLTRDVLSASAGARTTALTKGSDGSALTIINVTDGGASGSDQLEIWSIDATRMATVIDVPSSTAFTVDNTSGFNTSDWFLFCDLSYGTMMKLASASGTSISLASAPILPASMQPLSKFNAWVFKARHATYKIDSAFYGAGTPSGNASALVVDLDDGNGFQPLAEGVEDLQVALAIDSNGDGVIATENASSANADEWIYNVSGEAQPANLANLKAVRVTLVGKSTTADKGTLPLRPAIEDRAAASSKDGFFRRIVKSEIAVRNLNL